MAPFKAETKASVGLMRVIGGDAALLNKTPLFMPTEWNTAQKEIVFPKSGGVFSDYAPKFAYDESELRSLKQVPAVTSTTADALALAPPGPPLLGFGRSDVRPAGLSNRSAFVEVVSVVGGQPILAEPFNGVQLPEATVWRPMEFLAIVDAAGLTGPLVTISHSGVEEVDVVFQKYLTQVFKIGARLSPGVYRICVGP